MKIQNLIFAVIFILVFWRRNSAVAARLGIICLILATLLFNLQVFFTAERLTWYAAAFFAYATILGIIRVNK